MEHSNLAARVAARYKHKKRNPNGGEPIYLYSERQVARRNNDKAKRLEALQGKISGLRAQVKKDLKSDDPSKALTALAVALIDHTFERVGNEKSTEGDNEDGEPHFGVTTWKRDHISFAKGKATIKYVGKSGVKQNKSVTDKSIVTALRNAYEACEDDNLFCHASGKISARNVNEYLKKFDVTAKDLRGFHANRLVREALSKARSSGGSLPEDPSKREDQLKKEFKAVIEEVADQIGHTPSTLKNQYLTPGVEDQYLKDGGVPKSMVVSSIVERFRLG